MKLPRRKVGKLALFLRQRKVRQAVKRIWQEMHPQDTIIAAEQSLAARQFHPGQIYDETTPAGPVKHLRV